MELPCVWSLSALKPQLPSKSVGLMQFDQVLGLATGAAERLVDMLGRSGLDAGDHETDVEALCGGLDPGAGTAIGFQDFAW